MTSFQVFLTHFLTLNRQFLRLSLPGELCELPTVTPRQSKHRGNVPGLPVMQSPWALKCAHVRPWLHSSSLGATKAPFPGTGDVHRAEGSLAGLSCLCCMAGGSAPRHAVDEPLGAEPQKAQSALVTALLLSLQSVGGRWTEVALPPRKLLASLPRAPPLAGAAPVQTAASGSWNISSGCLPYGSFPMPNRSSAQNLFTCISS